MKSIYSLNQKTKGLSTKKLQHAIILVCFSFLFFMPTWIQAQCPTVVNPDLTNANGEDQGDAPNSWAISNGTPDVVNGTVATGLCDNNAINVCGSYAPGTTNTTFGRFRNTSSSCGGLAAEGISQNISGLSSGETYYLCFWAVNVGQADSCSPDGEDIDLQVTLGGALSSITIPYVAGDATWNQYCVPVVANSGTETIIFQMPGATAGLGLGAVFFDLVTLECTDLTSTCAAGFDAPVLIAN